MESEPTASDEVVKVALPPTKLAVPSVVPPFLKVTTSPFGGVFPIELTVVAAKVVACPTVTWFDDDVIVVVVAALPTTCCSTGDVLEAKFASPPYTAVMLYDPRASVGMFCNFLGRNSMKVLLSCCHFFSASPGHSGYPRSAEQR